MKTLWITSILAMAALAANAQNKVIAENQLPQEIASYIKSNFPNNAVLQAGIDNDDASKSYKIVLKDNISLEFNSSNKLTDVDSNKKLPDSVVPKSILEYVRKNYPKNVITDWELESTGQQVELDNGLELNFSMQGDFIKIDD